MRGRLSISCAGAFATLAVAMTACGTDKPAPTRVATTPAPTPSKEEVIERVRNAVAQITGKTEYEGTVSGTLTIINAEKGLAITNAHVVAGMTQIRANFGAKGTSAAVVRAVNSCADLALVEIKDVPEGTLAMPFAPESMKAGAAVSTAGYSGVSSTGSQAFVTITSGSITAEAVKNANLGSTLNRQKLMVQTDAAINPGNAGGPLFNGQGQIVGINTYSLTTASDTNFAIDQSVVRAALPGLMAGRKGTGLALMPVRSLNIGSLLRTVYASENVSPSWARLAGRLVRQEGGLLVTGVEPNSPADEAGVKPGMWVTKLNGGRVQSLTGACRTEESLGTRDKLKLEGWHLFSGSLAASYTKSFTRRLKDIA